MNQTYLKESPEDQVAVPRTLKESSPLFKIDIIQKENRNKFLELTDSMWNEP